MRLVAVVIFIFSSCLIGIKVQTAQEFIKSCIQETRLNGASSIIVNATLCSVCEGTFEGFIYSKELKGGFQVRYLRSFDNYDGVKVPKDTTIKDLNIEGIFNIERKYQDSILWQLGNMEQLLTDTIIENGKTIYRMPLEHGKLEFLSVSHNDVSETSLKSVIDLNNIFEKAYYYWIFKSSINNYNRDFLENRICSKK
jgi:hypothetical protein